MTRILKLLSYLVFVVGLPYAQGTASSAQDQSVHALRSAYLYYFSHFITWPAETKFDDNQFGLCAVTDDVDDRFQLNTIEGRFLEGNRLIIIVINPSSKIETAVLENCHLLFIGSPYSRWLTQVEQTLPSYTLIVSEGNQDDRSLITLFVEDKKLKFEIDVESLLNRGFRASSKLLRLAAKRQGSP